VGSLLLAAHVALIAPTLHPGMPAGLTASTSLDALTNGIECYTGFYAQPITDAVALMAVEYLAGPLRIAFAQGHNLVIGVAIRAVQEEHTLRAELPGYTAYLTQAKDRLIPFVW
jgi:choline dehydrogenase